ncbi:MAG: YfiR family protein [Methylomicrobium sp.]
MNIQGKPRMGKRGKTILPLLLGLSLTLQANTRPSAATQSLEEQSVLAALALNIVRFTNWPSEAEKEMKEAINFCVVGDNVVQQSFTSIDDKTVGDKTLRVLNLSRLRNFDQCHVLYISDLKQNVLLQLLVEIKKRPVLTIGEDDNFAEYGGMIGLRNDNGKINLYINLPVAKEANLNISARLLKLAKIIGN